MDEKLAIKRLTASDCTLFEGVFRSIGAGNQKSINLNADVLTGMLFPDLSAAASATENEIPLSVSIYGPGGKGRHAVARKIIKNSSYKNWRLDGEFIPGPPDDLKRYDGIQPGDLAVMAFRGDPLPFGMDLIIVTQSEPADARLHAALLTMFGNKSMIRATSDLIATAATTAMVTDDHPIHLAASDPELDAALEDAAQGGLEGRGKLLRSRGGRGLTGRELARAKARAERVGQEGEGLINAWLASRVAAGQLAKYTWVSVENAVAPYDFDVFENSGRRVLIDVKSTAGAFDNPIHVSLAEIIEAAGPTAYEIYRVFGLDDNGGDLKISTGFAEIARRLKYAHETHLPAGVRVDAFSISPALLNWKAPEHIWRPDEER